MITSENYRDIYEALVEETGDFTSESGVIKCTSKKASDIIMEILSNYYGVLDYGISDLENIDGNVYMVIYNDLLETDIEEDLKQENTKLVLTEDNQDIDTFYVIQLGPNDYAKVYDGVKGLNHSPLNGATVFDTYEKAERMVEKKFDYIKRFKDHKIVQVRKIGVDRNELIESIVKQDDGYYVKSEKKGKDGKRKNLGGPYPTKEKAEERLAQVEKFKHMKENLNESGYSNIDLVSYVYKLYFDSNISDEEGDKIAENIPGLDDYEIYDGGDNWLEIHGDFEDRKMEHSYSPQTRWDPGEDYYETSFDSDAVIKYFQKIPNLIKIYELEDIYPSIYDDYYGWDRATDPMQSIERFFVKKNNTWKEVNKFNEDLNESVHDIDTISVHVLSDAPVGVIVSINAEPAFKKIAEDDFVVLDDNGQPDENFEHYTSSDVYFDLMNLDETTQFSIDMPKEPTPTPVTKEVDSSEFGGELTYIRNYPDVVAKFDEIYTQCEAELNSKLGITLTGEPFGRYSRAWKNASIPVDDKRTIKLSLTYSLPDGIYNYITVYWDAELTTQMGAGKLYGLSYESSSRTDDICRGYHSAYRDGSKEEIKGVTIDELVTTIKTKYLREGLDNFNMDYLVEDYDYDIYDCYVKHYIGEDEDVSLDEIWNEIYEKEHDEDLANDVIAEVEKFREDPENEEFLSEAKEDELRLRPNFNPAGTPIGKGTGLGEDYYDEENEVMIYSCPNCGADMEWEGSQGSYGEEYYCPECGEYFYEKDGKLDNSKELDEAREQRHIPIPAYQRFIDKKGYENYYDDIIPDDIPEEEADALYDKAKADLEDEFWQWYDKEDAAAQERFDKEFVDKYYHNFDKPEYEDWLESQGMDPDTVWENPDVDEYYRREYTKEFGESLEESVSNARDLLITNARRYRNNGLSLEDTISRLEKYIQKNVKNPGTHGCTAEDFTNAWEQFKSKIRQPDPSKYYVVTLNQFNTNGYRNTPTTAEDVSQPWSFYYILDTCDSLEDAKQSIKELYDLDNDYDDYYEEDTDYLVINNGKIVLEAPNGVIRDESLQMESLTEDEEDNYWEYYESEFKPLKDGDEDDCEESLDEAIKPLSNYSSYKLAKLLTDKYYDLTMGKDDKTPFLNWFDRNFGADNRETAADIIYNIDTSKEKRLNRDDLFYVMKYVNRVANLLKSSNVVESLDEAKNDTLNTAIWDGEELKPEVKEKLQLIADKFIEKLEEDDIPLDVDDIVIVGSNRNYNYGPQSDIDLHIIADLSQFKGREKELAEKIYQCKKSIFNDKYDPMINGFEVEIYVEPAEDKNNNDIPDEVEESLNEKVVKTPYKIQDGKLEAEVALQELEDLKGLYDSGEIEDYKSHPTWRKWVSKYPMRLSRAYKDNRDIDTLELAIDIWEKNLIRDADYWNGQYEKSHEIKLSDLMRDGIDR